MDGDDCPISSKAAEDQASAQDELGILTEQRLIAAGWVRRHLADPDRAKEALDLYRSMGFEVKVQTLSPKDFGAKCKLCAETVCGSYSMIYTRRR